MSNKDKSHRNKYIKDLLGLNNYYFKISSIQSSGMKTAQRLYKKELITDANLKVLN